MRSSSSSDAAAVAELGTRVVADFGHGNERQFLPYALALRRVVVDEDERGKAEIKSFRNRLDDRSKSIFSRVAVMRNQAVEQREVELWILFV